MIAPSRAARVRRAVMSFAVVVDRPMPWRGERDPYRILVSEVMLQQTQASRVAAPYRSFCARFPTVEALAAAEPAAVLRAWGSLGYNRRALNLHRAARAIVERGRFPRTVADLMMLPGVGPYTARAVASFAFGADEAAVDANVMRILTRLEGLPAGTDVQAMADLLAPRGRAAVWNQGMFDLGALVCVPRAPRCEACCLQTLCAWASGDRPARPPTSPSTPFHQTRRYVRGRVLELLRGAPRGLDPGEITRRTGIEEDRVLEAVGTLERDGLVETVGDLVRLGGVGQRARSRKSAMLDTT